MIIRPQGMSDQQIPYAAGRFAERDAFVINQIGAASPFGGLLCSLGTDYAIELMPDGSGCTWFAGTEITSSRGLGKAWYIKDSESGAVWSAFFSPVGQKSDEYEVSYSPGQVSVFCLKNKIASTLTIATIPNATCEIWSVKLENRSAVSRTLTFTTYVEPAIAPILEAIYRERDKTLLMRRPLDADDMGCTEGPARDLVIFHTSTLTPTRFTIEKTGFIGDERTLQNPEYIEREDMHGENATVSNPIASFTVEVELPIEGEAELAFCFGVAGSPEVAMRTARAFSRQEVIDQAVSKSRQQWEELSGALKINTSDKTFDALINTWLPYETYSGWIRERSGPNYLDPSRVADVLRCLYPLSATSLQMLRESLLSFAAGLSVLGSYSPDKESLVSLAPLELLWLPIVTARYVAETGDKGILSESIVLRDGPALPLKEHCERVIRMCLNTRESVFDSGDARLLVQTVKMWSLINEKFKEAGKHLDTLGRRVAERNKQSEQRILPRRVRYFQSITPTLNDQQVIDDMLDYLGSDVTGVGDVDATCTLYSALVEWTIGLNATYEGLTLDPRLPESWFECSLTRHFRGDTYNITIHRSASHSETKTSIVVDGEPVLGNMLPFFGDGKEHVVEVTVS